MQALQQRQVGLLKDIQALEARLARISLSLRPTPPKQPQQQQQQKAKPAAGKKPSADSAAAAASASPPAALTLPSDDDPSRWWDESTYTPDATGVIPRLTALGRQLGFTKSRFYRVRGSYYDEPLEARQALLGLPATRGLFKAVVMENTQRRPVDEATGREHLGNPQFVVVLTSYTEKLHKESLARALREYHAAATARANAEAAAAGSSDPPRPTLPNKAFSLRLAEENTAVDLTGYSHNAMSPLGLAKPEQFTLLLSDTALALEGGSIAFGGGEVDVKWRTSVKEFVQIFKPIVARVVA